MTTTDTDALAERIARALRQATDDGADRTEDYAAAVLPIVAEEVRKAKAEALREAADAWHAEHKGTRPGPYKWMWNRATEYETGDQR